MAIVGEAASCTVDGRVEGRDGVDVRKFSSFALQTLQIVTSLDQHAQEKVVAWHRRALLGVPFPGLHAESRRRP